MADRALTLVLHDVAAETWPDYRPFVEAVDAIGGVPITWLVVPDFHRRNPLERQPEFRRLLDHRLQRGDELVLHGCYHADLEPAPRNPRDWFMRRVYTHEGEFYSLDMASARQRLDHGMELFRRHGWPLHGFVAPAWLMSPGTRRALADSGLVYTAIPGICSGYRNSRPSSHRDLSGVLAAPGVEDSPGWSASISCVVIERPRCCGSGCIRWICATNFHGVIGRTCCFGCSMTGVGR